MSDDAGFLSRWSRRKVQARTEPAPHELQPPSAPREAPPPGPPPVATPSVAPAVVADLRAQPSTVSPASTGGADEKPALPTLADVAALTRESDYSRFVAPGVDGTVKNAALKKLFGDPHFNVMDRLDVYIDDYNKPDPLPLASIRKMAQAAFLGLVDATPPAPRAASADTTTPVPAAAEPEDTAAEALPGSHEDADLRLQPHDAAGCGGAEDGAAADERRLG